jgi:ubiquinone/menaquinone biosynthesis C-methylase UbiE
MTEPANKSEIANAYDDWAETYDTVPNRTRDLAGQVLRKTHLNLNGRTVVEVGCGTGRNTEWLVRSEAGANDAAGPTSDAAGPTSDAAGPTTIFALDFSAEMLARARRRVSDPRVRFMQHDIRRPWPLADASADVVIAMLILEHVEHLEPFFTEAARTLTASGKLFICELHPMRQYLGGQARFINHKTGENTRVAAFLHDVSDYVNAGLAAGLSLVHLGEWRDDEEPVEDTPRVLSLHFRRGAV